MNILLIGMMGAGKTTVGRKLASALHYTFVDTDQEIEQDQGCGIEQIFSYAGEDAFRTIETKILSRYIGKKNLVLSTGGGVVLLPQNFEIMNQIGKTIYLHASQEELLRRLGRGKNRPLLTGDIEARLKKIFVARASLYKKADIIIDTDKKDSMAVVAEIKKHFFV